MIISNVSRFFPFNVKRKGEGLPTEAFLPRDLLGLPGHTNYKARTSSVLTCPDCGVSG